MAVEIVAGEKYRNRRGEYEVLEITGEGRLKVRYVQDGSMADLDIEQQLRILTNMKIEEDSLALAAANVKPAKSTGSRSSKTTASTAKPTASRVSKTAAAKATPVSPVRNQHAGPPELKPAVPVRREFTKIEVLPLLQFIGFGHQDSPFWFIGNQEIGPSDGNVVLSERSNDPEFHKEFADAEIYKNRYRTETSYVYGSAAWQFTNYLVSSMVLPPAEQNDSSRQKYFRERFGSKDGDVLLIDATALPARSTDAEHWPYRNSVINDSPLYNTVLTDPKRFSEDQLFGQATRFKRLNELYEGLKLQKSAPKYVFCFGRLGAWRGFKEIFPLITTYSDLELRLHPDRDRTARLSLGQDDQSGTHIVMMPPFNQQGADSMTYHYLDQVASVLLTLKAKETARS